MRNNIPAKEILNFNVNTGNDFECIFVEININKTKWFIIGTYNPCNANIKQHLNTLSTCIDLLGREFDNFVIIGDFNSQPTEIELKDFCNIYCLKNLINKPTCFKNINNPSCIDLFLTNKPNQFQHSTTIETGISDFHKMTVSVLKTTFKKLPPKIITYRNYKGYSHNKFNLDLREMLDVNNIYNLSNDEFVEKIMNLLDRHAPIKHKY